jgi:spore maturation protein CgeB
VKLVIFGLTISSAWGNGHATLWRGLCRALGDRGHHVTFFERDVPYYAAHRDTTEPAGCQLRLYADWAAVCHDAAIAAADADVAMVTSYCADAIEAARLVLDSQAALRVFYDLDTPVTLASLDSGKHVSYLPVEGLGSFDLVLSYTGGRALTELRERLGARQVAPLYGSVDPDTHRPVERETALQADLSYLGTYAADRQDRLARFFLEPARCRPQRRFVIGGAQYPEDFPWTRNTYYVHHMPPPDHAAFFSASALTLNVTRAAMADMGYCPSGRLFEAAACGTPVLSDTWEGLNSFFEPGREILLAQSTEDALEAIDLPHDTLRRIGRAARERTLAEHTAVMRAMQLEDILIAAASQSLPDVGSLEIAR